MEEILLGRAWLSYGLDPQNRVEFNEVIQKKNLIKVHFSKAGEWEWDQRVEAFFVNGTVLDILHLPSKYTLSTKLWDVNDYFFLLLFVG